MALLLHVIHNRIRPRKARVFRHRTNPLDEYDDGELLKRYRLSRELILQLYEEIGAELEPQTQRNHAIPAIIKICCALRYYASGSYQAVLGDGLGIHKSSVSVIINSVTDKICHLRGRYIKFPRTFEEQRRVKEGFHEVADMPNVLGAIDGTLINIVAPEEEEHVFVNRKGNHSLNVVCVCDSKMRYTYCNTKYPGSSHDSYIWENSQLYHLFENGILGGGWLLGDSGYVHFVIFCYALIALCVFNIP